MYQQLDSTISKPAPGALALVQAFVNSVELDTGEEALSNPEGLREWLAERELLAPSETVTDGDVRRAIELREGLRALLLANNDGELEERAVTSLNRAAARAGMRVRFDPTGMPGLEPDATGVDAALARLLAIVATARADGTWPRLKACREDTCQWAFYDQSKNRSGRWCTMDVCGNRSKARAYRTRRGAGAPKSGR
jgi:predicted RNA-binding Zn ribbon-like protein